MRSIFLAAFLLAVCYAAHSSTTPVPFVWSDPGPVEELDFAVGPGGLRFVPRPPFHFVREMPDGTLPKIEVRDAHGTVWRVKGGHEVHSDPFSSRVVWACGYYADPIHFVAEGRVERVSTLKRARKLVAKDGSFHNAVFETTPSRYRYLPRYTWRWDDNPFTGTHELNGLKILVMLLSDWDNKDAREFGQYGSNTGMLETTRNGRGEIVYYVNDWGETMGSWGRYGLIRSWNCDRYTSQTQDFVRGIHATRVEFGFSGFHSQDFMRDITVADVRWLLQYLGRITDEQFRAGIRACGGTGEQAECFTRQLRARIDQLRRVSQL